MIRKLSGQMRTLVVFTGCMWHYLCW